MSADRLSGGAGTAAPRKGGGPASRGLLRGVLALLLVLVAAVLVCEWLGWPFLAKPIERKLAEVLQRHVSFGGDAAGTAARLKLRLLGRLRIEAPYLEIGAPQWSRSPHLLVARDATLRLGYGDLWHAYRGAPLRIRGLRAARADIVLERLADGRASWQFGPPPAADAPPTQLPRFDRLEVDAGNLRYADAPMDADVQASFSLVDGSGRSGSAAPAGTASVAASSPGAGVPASGPNGPAVPKAGAPNGLKVDASGRWRGFPLKIDLQSIGVLPWVADDAAATAIPLRLDSSVGGARLAFDGTVTDALRLAGMQGRFTVSGPSLAAVGQPLGVTLPTTAPFRTQGLIARQGTVWSAVFDSFNVGSSRLTGAFRFDNGLPTPLLAGRLGGSKLLLADLGPAFGGKPKGTSAAGVPPAAAASSPAAAGTSRPGRVLPDRRFDLPSLRAMDANVLVDIGSLDLGTELLEPLQPLRGHLVLQSGVLTLSDLDTRTAQGRLAGRLQLDGRGELALWNADLRWDDVRLERFIHQSRDRGQPPYVAGRLRGEAKLEGRGRSSAEILGSLRGNLRTHLRDGAVSHLAVEAGGIDVAQVLGVFIKGDDSLPVSCGVADLAVADGRITPRVLVIDTPDSTLWIDGSLSLASEAFDLRAVVSPKDFSPLTLRTPVRVGGTFAHPGVSLEKGPLARTIGASVLLAFINPLAALIPLIDMGQPDEAKRDAAGCAGLVQRGQTSRATAPPSRASK